MSKLKLEAELFIARLFSGPTKYERVVDNDGQEHRHFYLFSFQRLAKVTLSLPFCGFIFCIIYSMIFNFVDATSTHCGVDNYLPSVSASIGSFSPQKYIWRATIALHSTPRYIVALIYRDCMQGSKNLFKLSCIEITALLGLSIVSSTENFSKFSECL